MLRANRMWYFALVMFWSATLLSAQVVTGTISGRVSDSSGAVLPGANLEIRNVETGFSRTITTDAAGRYTARNLPLGSYTVTA
ncbi:MAG: TonB-dependent receptor, partial [Acidobacteria bacterium]|nr:TonB-dependent receptor [Acidobacteriota bacterium]